MAYQFDFTFVPDYADMLTQGIGYTLGLTVVGSSLGILIGIDGALSRTWNPINPVIDQRLRLIGHPVHRTLVFANQ
jgi:ABC-type amino acid transport system permease subunit